MTERRVDAFFYGLFMDPDVLRGQGVLPARPRNGHVDGFSLRIGERATLVPSADGRAYGVVYALTHAELARLYGAPGLEAYRPEALTVGLHDGQPTAALCYNLADAPSDGTGNADYAARLRDVLQRLGFPPGYVESVG